MEQINRMDQKERLLKRLDEIGQSLQQSNQALALLGLGSVGKETTRIDKYSDLDFFAIVNPGTKQQFLTNLDWLARIHPLAYYFQNTVDGHKALFEDDIFCEFAVFEPQELSNIPFAEGRIVWQQPDFDQNICQPKIRSNRQQQTQEWLLGELLTNLYVGLGRYKRGEKLIACRMIQHYAVDRILELAELIEKAQPSLTDPFSLDRRFEQRYPGVASELPKFIQGYDRCYQSAIEIIVFVEKHFQINKKMKERVLALTREE